MHPHDSQASGVSHRPPLNQERDLQEECARYVLSNALLLDPWRVAELAQAALSHGSGECAKAIELAVAFAIERDRQRAQEGTHEEEADYEFLSRDFLIPADGGPMAATRFNALHPMVRRDTLNYVVRGIDPKECVPQSDARNEEEVITRARTGVLAILGVDEAAMLERAFQRLRLEAKD